VHVRTRRGSPARELAAAAEEFCADALVIGAPRHFWHRVAGSVSGWLARHARCPVIVVPLSLTGPTATRKAI
jgi:nucleotide-binding universal stress UspA family protein